MKEAYKKCMKEKNTIKIKSYESPCGVLLLGSFSLFQMILQILSWSTYIVI